MKDYTVSAHSRNGFGTRKSMRGSIPIQTSMTSTSGIMYMALPSIANSCKKPIARYNSTITTA